MINIKEVQDRMAEMEKKRQDALQDIRPQIIQKLKDAGITSVKADYDGYGDSGQVSGIEFEPKDTRLQGDDNEELENFVWTFVYNLNPGFEINDGADGEFAWDVAKDSIDVTHHMNVTERETTDYENL